MAIGTMPGSQENETEEQGLFSEINITPLTDIFLVLLIIFMVTSTVIVDMASGTDGNGVKVQVAQRDGQSSPNKDKIISVELDPSGHLTLDGEKMTPSQLTDALQVRKQQNPEVKMIIKPSDATPYRYVLGMIGLAQKTGIPFSISGNRPIQPQAKP